MTEDSPKTDDQDPAGPPEEPTLAMGVDSPTVRTAGDEPTLANADSPPVAPAGDEPTLTTGTNPTASGAPALAHAGPPPVGDTPTLTGGGEMPTVIVGGDESTMTGPTVAGWPFDETDADLPGELVWQSDPHPSFDNRALRETRSPGYYISLGAAVVIVVGLVAAVAVLTVMRPSREVAGSAVPSQSLPSIDTPSTTTEAPPSTRRPPVTEKLAEHPLSTSTETMAQSTCELPRFDPADAAQKTFYEAAKVCADAAWRSLFPDADVRVVTVIGTPAQTPCGGAVAPDDPATQCQGTVYMTPAHLRDGERNGRFPGRYFGVFLREYAEAVQYRTGLTELAGDAESDLADQFAQQATCLAGITSGAMAGRGAVDTNITNEIRDRLTTVDAPPDAAAWLADGFQSRQPSSCNTWLT